ncbi:MAG: NlpC/P60 family protein [Pseudomonadota bacterium]
MSNAIVAEARAWLGTPYAHQASTKGVGCDCLGLIRGIWRAQYGAEPCPIPAYTPDWSEPQGDEALLNAAQTYLHPATDTEAPGDVLLFRMARGAVAKHLGILSLSGNTPHFIHAYAGHGVVESPLSAPWARRIVARFTFTKD